jgi:putative effector of murein hydrolase
MILSYIFRAYQFAKKLRRMMQYSFFVRMLIEEFIMVFLSSMINILRPNYDTWGEIFSFSLSIFMIVSALRLLPF